MGAISIAEGEGWSVVSQSWQADTLLGLDMP